MLGAGPDGPIKPRRMSLYLLPNLFTSASLFLALFAMVKVAEGHYIDACWLILGSAVCDAIDGPVARWTRTASRFGVEYDSLADVVAFGVAPAFLMYSNLKTMDALPDYAPKLALGACALFAICSAIRLARFNVQSETNEKRTFTGLPTPGAAGVVVTAYLFVEWLKNLPGLQELIKEYIFVQNLHRLNLVLMVGTAFLMVSEIPFPKLRQLLSFSTNPFQSLVILVVVLCLLITFQGAFPVVVFTAFAVYVLSAVGFHLKRRMSAARPRQPAV